MSTSYKPPQYNIFQATQRDKDNLIPTLLLDKWYFMHVGWQAADGPFETEIEAVIAFQDYVMKVRMYPSCEV